ncbi:MAG: glycosyltransferase [Phycisphaeraceae bacterium]
MPKLPISLIILTLNEEHYLPGLLENVQGWVEHVFVVDSLSTDRTVDIALDHGATVVQRPFTNFGDQWNWALDNLPITTDWVMKLDPDERVTPALEHELRELFKTPPSCDVYGFRRRLWFLGKPMRQTQWVTRLWRTGTCRFSDLLVNEHPIVEGREGKLNALLEHYDSPDLDHWLRKQNRYTTMRAIEAHQGNRYALEPRLFGKRLERRMFFKWLYSKLPASHWWMWCYLMFAQGAIFDGYVGRSWAWLRAGLSRWHALKVWEMQTTGRVLAPTDPEVGDYHPRVIDSEAQRQAFAADRAARGQQQAEQALVETAHRFEVEPVPPGDRLHIVHYLAYLELERGGVVRAVLDIAAASAARGHRVTILTHTAADVPEDWRHHTPGRPRVIVIDPPAVVGGPISRTARRSVEAMLRDADVLHLHEVWHLPNLQLAASARRAGVPYVVSPHGTLSEWPMEQKWLKKRAYLVAGGRRYLDRAACVLCTASEELRESQTIIPYARLAAIPLICDLTQFQHLPGPALAEQTFPALAGDDFRILYLSRLHPKKGADVLVEAMRILTERGVKAKLFLAGPESERDYARDLIDRIERYNLAQRVLRLGMVRGDVKLSLYEAADVFALPTYMENFGLVQVEAMACGTPVITTRGVAIWRELEEAGALIVDRDPVAFADAIERLVDAERRAALPEAGREARRWVVRNLTVNNVIPQYEQLYARLAGRRDADAGSAATPVDATLDRATTR